MLANRLHVQVKQLPYQLLTKLNRTLVDAHRNAAFACLRGEDQEFGCAVADLEGFG